MNKSRKYRSSEQKLAIVKRHQLEKVSVSDICETESIAPSQFYRWQQELFDHGAVSFDQGSRRQKKTAEQEKIERLERQISVRDRKLSEKNEVIAELLGEHTKLKKSLGEG